MRHKLTGPVSTEDLQALTGLHHILTLEIDSAKLGKWIHDIKDQSAHLNLIPTFNWLTNQINKLRSFKQVAAPILAYTF